MSTLDINKLDNEDDNKSPDKQQIEAEEKEVMLKSIESSETPAELKADDGPVKAALSGDVTEQGREVKPKFIPIGAIKMPGFFTRNSDKDKTKDEEIEKDGDNEKSDESKPKRHRFQFLHTCPFTQFLHHPRNENEEGNNERKRYLAFLDNIKYPKMFQRRSEKDPEATLASMETLEDKLDAPNDGMENVKLDVTEEEGKVATKLPLRERIRQKKFIIDDLVVCCVVVVVLLAVVTGIAITARAGPPKERPLRLGRYATTITNCGEVEGLYDEGVFKFYSIPYAIPPVGERRFTYAQQQDLAACWNGTLEAHRPGPVCLQILEDGNVTGAEDCLTLDVVTPHVRYDSPLPVVVLLGAGSLAGGADPARPSALYARTKEVVFVRPNFRLGPFGFLALDALARSRYPPTAGNYALSDLVAALRWVRHNVKYFGGDPAAVTLLAHRAGASLAAALTAVRRAHRLYARVWLSEPSVVYPTEPLDVAVRKYDQFKQLTKCEDVECLRRISSTEILSSTPDVWMTTNIGTVPQTGEIRRSWLVMDGDLLREPVNESWAEQKRAKETGSDYQLKPMVLGTTLHSAHSNVLRMKHLNWTTEIVERTVQESVFGERRLTEEVFKHFNKTYEGLVELIGAVRTLCPLLATRAALGAGLYVSLGGGGLAGAGADVEAILGTFDSEMPEQRRFMAAMQHLFYYFVWHGSLPGPDAKLLAVGQDSLPLPPLPACKMLEENGLVPQFAHID